jgi:hypothetical protein
MFDARDTRMLGGLSLEKQVVEILLEEDAVMTREQLRRQLVPPPNAEALGGIITRLCNRNYVVEFANGVGLPGWALTKAQFKPQAPAPVELPAPVVSFKREAEAAAPQAPSPSMETTMPKKRIPKEQSEALIANVLTEAGLSIANLAKEAGVPKSAASFALEALAKSKRAHKTRAGKGWLWHKGAANTGTVASGADVAALARELARGTPARPPANGKARFGYFDDGSISINVDGCVGTINPADLKAFREFAEEHAK